MYTQARRDATQNLQRATCMQLDANSMRAQRLHNGVRGEYQTLWAYDKSST